MTACVLHLTSQNLLVLSQASCYLVVMAAATQSIILSLSPGGWHGRAALCASSALWSSEGPVCMKVCIASIAIFHLPER